ncbi:MAG: hypothetical protein P8L46_01980, partial [Acidimicrobiales bacterium]|nr:hypothetical protein [Acidimicrobiales bacterium]
MSISETTTTEANGTALEDEADLVASGAGVPRIKSRGRNAAETILPPLVMGGFFLTAWYLVSYLVLDERRRFLLRPP